MLSISSQGISSAFEGIIITDEKGTILEANEAFLKMTGFTEEEIIGKNPRVWKSGYQSAGFYKRLWNALIKKGHWSGELWDKYKKNRKHPVFLSISAVKNSEGDTTNYIGFFHDLSVIKEKEKQLEHIKLYDFLTGLPNKFLLTQNLDNYINQCIENRTELVVMTIRILGPVIQNSSNKKRDDVHDEIINEVVERIKYSTPNAKLHARVGFSEFVVVYQGRKTVESMESQARKVINTLAESYKIKRKRFTLQSTVGIVFFKKDNFISGE